MKAMFKDRFSNIDTSKTQIEKQREFDALQARLAKEFEALDINHDGLVSIEEMQAFLSAKVNNFFYVWW